MAIFGSLSTVRAQTEGRAGFARAFTYLDEVFKEGSEARQRVLAMELGSSHRVELSDGVFVIEQAYEGKARYDVFESHRRYLDIQVMVTGPERMEVAEITKLPVTQPYDVDRDVIIYGNYTAASLLWLDAGEAAVFYPEDGHMPNLRAGANPTAVRKVVVKVPV